jgi:hypothetical protein
VRTLRRKRRENGMKDLNLYQKDNGNVELRDKETGAWIESNVSVDCKQVR